MTRILTIAFVLFSIGLQAQTLNVNLSSINPYCNGGCNGELQPVVSGGSGVYYYQWSNGSTTMGITGLCAGTYTVDVVDDLGATGSATGTLIEPSAIIVDANSSSTTCGGADGSLTAFAFGGVTPYAYLWLPMNTTGPGVGGLPTGAYTLVVTDANGCTGLGTFVVTEDGLEAIITPDASDPCLGPVGLTASATGGTEPYLYTWGSGETTDVIQVSNTPVVTLSVVDANGCSASTPAYIPTPGAEMNAYLPGVLNRGFCNYVFPTVVNNACTAYNGPVIIVADAALNVSIITPTPDLVSGNTITWNNVSIAIGGQFSPNLLVCVPLTVNCGTPTQWNVTAGTMNAALSHTVVCSFDPNDKQVSPIGFDAPGYINYNQELTYTVQFQNTGDFAATFIHVIDTLDADLDILSLRVLATSHPMQLSIGNGNVLDFFFDNINLPDSTTDQAGSHGFVIYAITPLPGLTDETEIENTANIYFDFNEPVITNTTLNTIDLVLGMDDELLDKLSVRPNPASGSFDLQLVGSGTVTVFDGLGQLVYSGQASHTTHTIDCATWPTGIYTVMADVNGHRTMKRVVVM